jgi:hypothetical protein
MARKSKQEPGLLETGLKVAGEVVDSSRRAISRGVEQALQLNRAVLDYEADLIEPVSPTAAELLRPTRKKKSERAPAGRTGNPGEASEQAARRAGKQAKQTTTKAAAGAAQRAKRSAKKASRSR